MKLRNLMYATMIACAFASCSKDEVPTPDGGGDGETYLEVRSDLKATKADDVLTSLTLVVCDAAGNVEKMEKTSVGDAGSSSRKVAVTPGNKQVIMVANYDLTGLTTLGAIKTKTNTIDKEIDNGFSMNSVVYNIAVTANATNYLGYSGSNAAGKVYLTNAPVDGVKLYRNVAKVVLNTMTVKDVLGENNTSYANAQFKITDAYILNAKNTTDLIPADDSEWGTTQKSKDFTWVAGMATNTTAGKFSLAEATAFTPDFNSYHVALNQIIGYASTQTDTWVSEDKTSVALDKTFYVYENYNNSDPDQATKTLLVVKGDFSYDTHSGVRKVEADRYYTVAIGRTGFEKTNGYALPTSPNDFSKLRGGASGINGADANKAYDVLRNLQYNVSITITGLGYKTPGGDGDTQNLDVKVQVVGFGEVVQDVEI